jgi:hypothetical protein
MKRHAGLAIALGGLVLPIGLVVAIAAGSRVTRGPVYSAAQVQGHLAHDSQTWVGRIVRVRGVARACYIRLEQGHFRCMPQQARLSDPDVATTSESLPLIMADPQPALTFMRRIPQLGSLLPALQTADWGEVATYRVQLGRAPAARCGAPPYYEALLLDAAP